VFHDGPELATRFRIPRRRLMGMHEKACVPLLLRDLETSLD
jgi:hypothetical protein